MKFCALRKNIRHPCVCQTRNFLKTYICIFIYIIMQVLVILLCAHCTDYIIHTYNTSIYVVTRMSCIVNNKNNLLLLLFIINVYPLNRKL